MIIGIDKLGFYTPPYALDMETLAEARGVEPAKYTIGIGQTQMALVPITQDIVSMAANAAQTMLTEEDKSAIDMILFGTETGIDHSKSAAVYLQNLLGLSNRVRAAEIKHACYGATAALQLAKGHIMLNPDSKVLVIASDIAKYGLNSGGEPTQGAGAVAILVSANPKLISLDNATSFFTDDVMDFWRPTYAAYPYVDGKYSNEQYIRFFEQVWTDYKEKTGLDFKDYAALCFHLPYSKMGLKALKPLLEEEDAAVQDRLLARYQEGTIYNRLVGNIYTGSLFLSLISLLENSQSLSVGDRIGFFSYGSGAVGEFFSGQLVEGFQEHLNQEMHKDLLEQRQALSVEEYETMFADTIQVTDQEQDFTDRPDSSHFRLAGIKDHKRLYSASGNKLFK
ncbi:hydroxymethylglutaryl-CoA synthase [Granulicatella seriolae]|uniref:Hydroxymethylglutaryl-CoA synthase n=1 Tax=Granulicatella seriolae TaxID=2967226 RepID=A0ABT1WLW1_9LACT|nr:hydroxymethylglutaryl-CoA synthase [Granulicatella seriolae]